MLCGRGATGSFTLRLLYAGFCANYGELNNPSAVEDSFMLHNFCVT